MQLEDQLRTALRRDAAELQPVGPGPDHARRRAHRRKRRMQSGVLAASAAVLVGGTLAEIGTRSSSGGPRVAAQPTDSQPTPDLAWRSVDGTVLDQYSPKTNSDGVTYALSTAPGFIGPITNTTPQELYASRDGVSWTHTSLGAAPWLADLAPGDNGVLYAVGTGPSSQVGANDYRLKTSSNGGAQWDDTPIPVQLTTPHASVKLQPTTSVHVARGSHATVVAVQASYSLDLTAPTGDLQSYRTTDAGVEILDFSACNKNKPTTVTVDGVGAQGNPVPTNCAPTVTATHPWSDYGISDPAALHQVEVLVRTDGGDWQKVDMAVASDVVVQSVSATKNGFVMTEQKPASDGGATVVLLSSVDGRTWSPLTGAPAALTSATSSGDRIIGTDAASNVFVSNDGGVTWSAAQSVAALLPDGAQIEPYGSTSAAGPLGYVVTVRTGDPNHTKNYLLHSADGSSWKVVDLAAQGAPDQGYTSTVTVGTDHIAVAFQVNATKPNGALGFDLKTLIATPKA